MLLSCLMDGASSNDSHLEDEEVSFQQRVERRMKRQKMESSGAIRDYIDVSFIPCTSNACERLFSESKYILTPQRARTSPILFEALLFLKKNDRLWDMKEVVMALKRTLKAEVTEQDGDDYYE